MTTVCPVFPVACLQALSRLFKLLTRKEVGHGGGELKVLED